MNAAERIIKPAKAGIFRAVFLYTGQGESTLLVIPTGPSVTDYMYVLIDSDLDKEKHEIDLISMFKDLFVNSGKLEVFINTHPHNDHIGGIKEVYDKIGFKEVWHSNHKPGGEHKEKYKDFEYVLNKVGKANQFHLKGSDDLNKLRTSADAEVIKKLGKIDFQVLSPAEYLCDDIEDKDADERNRRIHEQCGVIRFTYGLDVKNILITGDSDKKAWKDHITDHHKKNLSSYVLSASHHGSRTFFKESEEDKDVYETHLDNIKPTYLIVSAPKQKDSPHGHPHDDAMEIYKKHVEEDYILHLGKNLECAIVDIDEAGKINVVPDKDLVAEYGQGNNDDNNGDSSNGSPKRTAAVVGADRTRLDNKPMGNDDTLV